MIQRTMRGLGAGRAGALGLMLLACGGAGANAPPTQAAPRADGAKVTGKESAAVPQAKTTELAADTPMKTASGASFEAPKGWFVTERPDGVISLEAPEKDLTLTLLEVAGEPDAAKALEAAWAHVQPGFARKVRQTSTPPARDGWDAIAQSMYETSGAESRAIIGVARRKGTMHYVTLVDGSNAALDRRGAQMGTVFSSFKAPGVEEESLAGRPAHALDAERAKLLDAFITDAMAHARVPGAAIAVVQGGELVHAKGYGLRDVRTKAPATAKTMFMIGSTTKSLTTLLMAKLIDEGKFGWETPVTDVLPSFALGDAAATKRVLMKHTVCACAGLPRQDMEFVFEFDKVTPEQRVSSMRGMKPTTGFGETFQYSNTMVAAGGYIAAHALEQKKPLGPAYDDAMRSRIFGPLGMKNTTLSFATAAAREHATPYAESLAGEVTALPLSYEGAVASVSPAGAAWSTAEDMAKIVALELAAGRDAKGNVFVSEANLMRRREPQIKITERESYGLGLFVENDHGLRVLHHGGNTFGFTSDMFVLPDQGVGVVFLTNAGSANALRNAVRRRVLELLFDAKEEAKKGIEFGVARRRDVRAKELAKISVQPDESWLKGLSGGYANAGLGRATVRIEQKAGVFDAGEWKSRFGQRKEEDGTIKAVLLDAPVAGLELIVGDASGAPTLTVDAGQQNYTFERR